LGVVVEGGGGDEQRDEFAVVADFNFGRCDADFACPRAVRE
jgi:hypothetical protein